MESIVDILNKKLPKAKGLTRVLSSMESEKKIMSQWTAVFDHLAKELVFGAFIDGVVFVQVKNPMWVTEFPALKDDFRKKLEAAVSPIKIKDIQLKTH